MKKNHELNSLHVQFGDKSIHRAWANPSSLSLSFNRWDDREEIMKQLDEFVADVTELLKEEK